MLDMLRKINWPDGVQPAGAIIPGALLSQVADYEGLIKAAVKKAEDVRLQFEKELDDKVEQIRLEISTSVKNDFKKLSSLVAGQREQMLKRSSQVCVEVAKIAVQNFIQSQDEQKKMSTIVSALISKLHSRTNVVFLVHPDRVALVQEILEKDFQAILKKNEYKINEDNTLEIDQVRVSSVEGAFIDMSIKNLISILCTEIEYLETYFAEEIKHDLQNNFESTASTGREIMK